MEHKLAVLTLHDGREVQIRQPGIEDLEKLMAFLTRLPDDIKQYLRYNVHDHEILSRRLKEVDSENHWRLVAELDGRIIADGTLDRDAYGWTRHIAELRVIVDDEFEGLGVRAGLCEEFVILAQQVGVERMQMQVPVERTDLIPILEGLGFRQELVRKLYAKGLDGKLHDVVFMTNDVDRMWKRLEESMHDLDTNFTRWFSGNY